MKIIIHYDDRTGSLGIASDPPDPARALAIVTMAYHELLTAKVRRDLAAEARVALVNGLPFDGRRLQG